MKKELILCMSIASLCSASDKDLDHHLLLNAFSQILPICEQYSFELLHGGWSTARNYTCMVNGQQYAARVITRSSNEIKKEIAAQRAAAAIGLAPHVYYYDEDAGLIIMDYIQGKTLSTAQAAQFGFVENIGHAIYTISRLQCGEAEKWDIFQQTYLKFELLRQKQTQLSPIFEHVIKTLKCVEQNIVNKQRPLVFCHGDLNPRNIFFTNNKLLFIDWSEACMFYEGTDLAIFSVFLCLSPEADRHLLETYFQRALTVNDIEYFQWLKLMIRAYDAAALFSLIDNLLATHETMTSIDIKDHTHYETIFANDATDNSPEFSYALAYTQLQEFLMGYDAVLGK